MNNDIEKERQNKKKNSSAQKIIINYYFINVWKILFKNLYNI